jgi:hypothetical protein
MKKPVLMPLLYSVIVVLLVSVSCRPSEAYSIFIDMANNGHASTIPTWLQSWGNYVTAVTDYHGEDLSGYDVVMDFDNDSWHALTLQEKRAYTSFLNHGGGLYLQGERPTDPYLLRDESVLAYLAELGSGTIGVDWRDIFWNDRDPFVHAVPSPVTQNTSLSYRYDTSLILTDPGNGFFVATTDRISYPGFSTPAVNLDGLFSMIIGFERGQLLNAPNGRVIGFFDTTYLDEGRFDLATNQPFFKEIVTYLGNSRTVSVFAPIPEPSSCVLFLYGGILLIGFLWRKKWLERHNPCKLTVRDITTSLNSPDRETLIS